MRDLIPADVNLDILADLRLDIDGASAVLTGAGQRLTMTLAQPADMMQAMRGSAVPVTLGEVADGLARVGVRLDVDSSRGRLLSLGSGVVAPFGRSIAGSRAVSAGPAVGYVGLAFVRDEVRRRAVTLASPGRLAVAGATVAAIAAGVVLRHRRSPTA